MADIPESRAKKPMPDTAKAKKGMSLNALIKNTPPYVKNRARDEVVIKKLSNTFTKGGMRAVRAVAVSTGHKVPTPHVVTIIGLDTKAGPVTGLKKMEVPRLYRQKRLQVDCDCENFIYYWEFALWSYGAAKIKRCNGDRPEVTNPHLVPGTCKHIIEVLRTIKEKGF